MPRIVSLLPSLTEIVCALGRESDLVGRSHECDFPPGVEGLPALTRPKFRPDGSSRAIDDRVKALVRDGLSVYRVDAGHLAGFVPDVVLTQDQCDVCAASLADVEAALAELAGGRPRVVSVAPTSLSDVWESIRTVGAAIGARVEAEALLETLTARISTLGEATGALPRPRVACVEWLDPLMTAGNWVPELVALAGGASLLARAGARSPWIDWDAIREARPDVVVAMPCGFDLARTRSELVLLTERPGFAELPAAKAGRVFAVDGNRYFNRPGPGLADSAEILAEILHPDRFDFGRAGRAFEAVAV